MAQTADFFVSYTGADTAWAEWIAQTLEDAGYQTVSRSTTPTARSVAEGRVGVPAGGWDAVRRWRCLLCSGVRD